MKDREKRISDLEQALGTRLPSAYRNRLAAGDPIESGTFVSGEEWYGLDRFFPLDELGLRREHAPAGHLPIGEDDGGNLIVLELREGSIFFCDHDVFEDEWPLTLLAPSFEEFVSGLRSDDELPDLPEVPVSEVLIAVAPEFDAAFGGRPEPRRQVDGSVLVPFGTEIRDGREFGVWRAIRPGDPGFDEWIGRVGG